MYIFDVNVAQRQHDRKFTVELLTIVEEEFAKAYYNKHKFLPAFCRPQWVTIQVFESYKVAKKHAQDWRGKMWRGGHPYNTALTTAKTTAT